MSYLIPHQGGNHWLSGGSATEVPIRNHIGTSGGGTPESNWGGVLLTPFASQTCNSFLGRWDKNRSLPCPSRLQVAELPSPTHFYFCLCMCPYLCPAGCWWRPGPAGARWSRAAVCHRPHRQQLAEERFPSPGGEGALLRVGFEGINAVWCFSSWLEEGCFVEVVRVCLASLRGRNAAVGCLVQPQDCWKSEERRLSKSSCQSWGLALVGCSALVNGGRWQGCRVQAPCRKCLWCEEPSKCFEEHWLGLRRFLSAA